MDAAVAKLAENAKVMGTLFPENTKGLKAEGKYSASPKIWENRADFDSHVASYTKTVNDLAASGIKNLDALKAAVPAVGKQCSGCHETYRLKEG